MSEVPGLGLEVVRLAGEAFGPLFAQRISRDRSQVFRLFAQQPRLFHPLFVDGAVVVGALFLGVVAGVAGLRRDWLLFGGEGLFGGVRRRLRLASEPGLFEQHGGERQRRQVPLGGERDDVVAERAEDPVRVDAGVQALGGRAAGVLDDHLRDLQDARVPQRERPVVRGGGLERRQGLFMLHLRLPGSEV